MDRPIPPMLQAEADAWSGSLGLRFARVDERSVLADNRHEGPLRVQKALYPEGDAICHAVIVHPPGGVAGGDRLSIALELEAGAQALVTTPGATKWYKARGERQLAASQSLQFKLAAGATLEWLPQESIVFDAAQCDMQTGVELAEGARYTGWEILCLGRTASGEQFTQGSIRQRVSIRHAGRLVWNEAGTLPAAGIAMKSAAGWHGATVCATLVVAGCSLPNELIDSLRAGLDAQRSDGESVALSRLPQVFVARYLGHSSERARELLTQLWHGLRPQAIGAAPHTPRIWRT